MLDRYATRLRTVVVRGFLALVAAVAARVSPAQFIQAHADAGAYAESGGRPDVLLTSWAVLGLRASRNDAPGSLGYLQSQESTLRSTTDVALAALAEQSLGATPTALLDRLRAARRANGQIGEGVNTTCWAVLALRRSTAATTGWLLAPVAVGGWSWAVGGRPDSNDRPPRRALHVAGVRGVPVTRAVRFLLVQNRDGGFELTNGRGSTRSQSRGRSRARRGRPHVAAQRWRLAAQARRRQLSVPARYQTTRPSVTSKVLAALAKKPFCLDVNIRPSPAGW
jgi:hypothetical protein